MSLLELGEKEYPIFLLKIVIPFTKVHVYTNLITTENDHEVYFSKNYIATPKVFHALF